MATVKVLLPQGPEPVEIGARLNGEQFSIDLPEGRHEGRVRLTAPGEGWLYWEGRPSQTVPFCVRRQGEQIYLWVAGQTFTLPLAPSGPRRSGGRGVADGGGAPHSGELKAPMPGTVLQVRVRPGDAVAENQPLVIMESMKMEMTLSAPKAAIVGEVLCEEGQLVALGAVLVKLETPSDENGNSDS